MLSLVEPVLMQLLMNGLNRPSKPLLPSKTGIALSAIALFLGCTGIIFMLMAFHELLLDTYAPWIAAVSTGAAALLLAAFAAAVALHLNDIRDAKARLMHQNNTDSLIAAIEAATKGLEDPIANHPRTSVVLASLAGFMAGSKLH
ncbi:MAG: hypothetical protein PW788_12310 [Micavibrio sp.]|nr:hypothetical protein [Micavibrio sp.]